jgi:hypothetical protein
MDFDRYHNVDLEMIFLIEVPEGIFHYKWTDHSYKLIQSARHHISNDDPTDSGPVIDVPKIEFVEYGSSYNT